jgi:hypothetical protein
VDESVRKTWQVDGRRVRFNNPDWEDFIKQEVMELACGRLGVEVAQVEARLYKLLLYTSGGHFDKHQE